MPTPPPLQHPADAAAQLGVTEGALAQMRYLGKGPKFVKMGRRCVRYRQEDIDEWVESCIRTRTDDPGVPATTATTGSPSPTKASRPRAGRSPRTSAEKPSTALAQGDGDAA